AVTGAASAAAPPRPADFWEAWRGYEDIRDGGGVGDALAIAVNLVAAWPALSKEGLPPGTEPLTFGEGDLVWRDRFGKKHKLPGQVSTVVKDGQVVLVDGEQERHFDPHPLIAQAWRRLAREGGSAAVLPTDVGLLLHELEEQRHIGKMPYAEAHRLAN